jgi:manganese transport protein
MFTRNRNIMGGLVNSGITTALASVFGVVILALNVILLYLSFGGTLPFL